MIAPSRSFLRFWRTVDSTSCPKCTRTFATTPATFSGHSRWSTIKHDKGKADAVKNKQRTIFSKDISNASKFHGPDPTTNNLLALAIANAKRAGFPKASIEAAILRGQGRSSSGAALEPLTIEAVLPPVALILECQTDSKLKALQDLRLILKNHGGTPTPTTYLFEKRGRIVFRKKEGLGADEVLEAALEAGAIDVVEGAGGRVVVDTEAAALKAAEKSIAEETGLELDSSDTIWFPKQDTKVDSLDDATLEHLEKLEEELEEYSGFQALYTNLDLAEPSQVEASP